MAKNPLSPRIAALLRESWWLVLVAAAVFLVLILYTYDPNDPGWSRTSSHAAIHNAGGWMGAVFSMHQMCVLQAGAPARIRARGPARIVVFGGDPLDGPRFIWWNFVASSRERIDRAAEDWKRGRFEEVPGETEFITLPER